MVANWIEQEYGDLLTRDEVCKVLRISKQKLASWVRYKHIHGIKVDGYPEDMYFKASEVQKILENPGLRNRPTKKEEKAADAVQETTEGKVAPETVDAVVGELKGLLPKLIEEEVERQRIVITRRERVVEKTAQAPSKPEDSEGACPNQKKESNSAPRELVDRNVSWRRPNSGTELFPMYI